MPTSEFTKRPERLDRLAGATALEAAARELTLYIIRPERVDLNSPASVRAAHMYEVADWLTKRATGLRHGGD